MSGSRNKDAGASRNVTVTSPPAISSIGCGDHPGREWLAAQFELYRPHLRAVAYRMLGSPSEADDAVQESWFRLSRGNSSAINDLRGWLTTVVGRICLDMLRSRRATREQTVASWLPEPVVQGDGPEQQAELADSLGFALFVVLDTLTPAERLAFVLHDVFALPFDEIAPIVERSPDATRQLAEPRPSSSSARAAAGP